MRLELAGSQEEEPSRFIVNSFMRDFPGEKAMGNEILFWISFKDASGALASFFHDIHLHSRHEITVKFYSKKMILFFSLFLLILLIWSKPSSSWANMNTGWTWRAVQGLQLNPVLYHWYEGPASGMFKVKGTHASLGIMPSPFYPERSFHKHGVCSVHSETENSTGAQFLTS